MLLRHQADIAGPTPMPTDRQDDTSVVNTSTAEAVVWYFVSSSAWTAAVGEATGTICNSKLTYSGVLNSMGTTVGSYNDTSLSFAAATRAETKVSVPENVFSEMVYMSPTDQKAKISEFLTTSGYYAIDHRRGQIWLKSKATVANDAATYKYLTPLTGGGTGDKVDLIKLGGIAIPLDDAAFTPGTSTVIPIGFFADETASDSVDEGDIGAPRMTLNRRLITASCYMEDVAHTDADYGNMILGVRKDTLAALAGTTGDYAPFEIDANGALYARIVTSAGASVDSFGYSLTDDAAYTPASSGVVPTGFFADETATDSVDEGDVGIAKMTLDRKQIGASEFTDDAAWVASSYVTVIGGVMDDVTTDVLDEGDRGYVRLDANRNMYETLGTLLAGESQSNLGYIAAGQIGIIATPSASSIYAYQINDISAALEASTITKAAPGVICKATFRLDSTAASATYYIHIINSATLPADGAVAIIACKKFIHTLGTDDTVSYDFNDKGVYCSAGIVSYLSSTEFTKTIGGAYLVSQILAN